MARNIDSELSAAQLQWRYDENVEDPGFLASMARGDNDGNVTPADHPPEHVLKTSKSFAARSYKGRQSTTSSLRVPSNISHHENSSVSSHDTFLPPPPPPPPSNANQPLGALSEIGPNGQAHQFRPGRSPTPSLKRAAVEAIVKSHGSPNHMRVTAGGRIVPSEQSPLCQPRYGYSAIKTNGSLIKFAPNQRFPYKPEECEQASDQNGQIVQDGLGNYYQIVDHKILALSPSSDGFVELHMAASNLEMAPPPASKALPSHSASAPPFRASGPSAAPVVSNALVVYDPSVAVQINALKTEYVVLGSSTCRAYH
jgi:hypothetical protein